MINQVFLFLSAAVVSFLLTYPIVRLLRFFRLTQSLREEGPGTHKPKRGTPTMGGIGFVLTIIAFAFISINFELDLRYLALIALTLGFALVGLIDDWIKIAKQRNLGLTFWQKIVLQVLLAASFAGYLVLGLGHHQNVDWLLYGVGLANPILYFLFCAFIVVGAANAANLTDGLNGLLAGCAGIAFLAFAVLSSQTHHLDAVTFSLIAAGAVLAFLAFNFPGADVFMGDVGSLPLGAALAGVAIIIHKELYLVVIGGIFVLEALSVILQVLSYKLWRKRIFKMAPLHHHFELMGINEIVIVVGFWLAGTVLGVVGVML